MEYKRKIIITKHSFAQVKDSLDFQLISFDELKEWVRRGVYFRKLLSYDTVVLQTYNFNVLGKPFLTAVLIRLLSSNSCRIEDEQGRSIKVNMNFLLLAASRYLQGLFHKGEVIRQTAEECIALTNQLTEKGRLDLTSRPVYLRTDLVFGLRSGGSVGHIAGVLNNLSKFTGKPVFFTADSIPTVSEDIEKHIIVPPADFLWDHGEVTVLQYNCFFTSEVEKILAQTPVSFIYQRYSTYNISGAILARKHAVPFVLEYNGSEIWIARNWGKPFRYERLAQQMEDLNLNDADVIVVISSPLRDELVRRGIDCEKILVNPNGVNPRAYHPQIDGSPVRNNYGLDNKLVVGFIGTFGKWHGAEVLAQAFVLLIKRRPDLQENIRLFFIGDGVTLPQVKEMIKENSLEAECVFAGLVPQADGPGYLAACDVLVSPQIPNADGSPFFGSPTKLFEYMAMGKAIIASDLFQLGEIIEHDVTGLLVAPGEVEKLTTAIGRLADDHQLRARLGVAARDKVIANYTWEEHTLKIIDKLRARCDD